MRRAAARLASVEEADRAAAMEDACCFLADGTQRLAVAARLRSSRSHELRAAAPLHLWAASAAGAAQVAYYEERTRRLAQK